MEIREFENDDLVRILCLEREIFPGEAWGARDFRLFLLNNGTMLVAEVDGAIVGYMLWLDEEEVHLANLAVLPAFRKQKIGHALMERLFEAAAQRSIILEVRAGSPAVKFYQDRGFVEYSVRPRYYPPLPTSEDGRYDDAILMRRPAPVA